MHMHTTEYNGTTLTIQSFGPATNSTYFEVSWSAYMNDRVMKLELLEVLNKSSTKEDFSEIVIERTTGENDDPIHFFANANFQGKL